MKELDYLKNKVQGCIDVDIKETGYEDMNWILMAQNKLQQHAICDLVIHVLFLHTKHHDNH
jgi:hypothetical protein